MVLGESSRTSNKTSCRQISMRRPCRIPFIDQTLVLRGDTGGAARRHVPFDRPCQGQEELSMAFKWPLG